MLHTRWKEQDFLFAMNGQTGKLIGDLPVDKGRVAAWFAGISIPLMILTALPPADTAATTPTRLPMPTRVAVETMRVWNDVFDLSSTVSDTKKLSISDRSLP